MKTASMSTINAEPEQLARADEVDDPDEDKHGAKDQCVDGETQGHSCAPHARAEAKAQGFSSGIALDAIVSRGLEPVELIPRILILIGHGSIIPRMGPGGLGASSPCQGVATCVTFGKRSGRP